MLPSVPSMNGSPDCHSEAWRSYRAAGDRALIHCDVRHNLWSALTGFFTSFRMTNEAVHLSAAKDPVRCQPRRFGLRSLDPSLRSG